MPSPTFLSPTEMTFVNPSTLNKVNVLVSEVYSLVCKNRTSNKYWRAYKGTVPSGNGRLKPKWYIVVEWGRVGGSGEVRRLVKTFMGEFTANRYLMGRVKDKENKGYVSDGFEVQVTAQDLVAAEAASPVVSFSSDWDLF